MSPSERRRPCLIHVGHRHPAAGLGQSAGEVRADVPDALNHHVGAREVDAGTRESRRGCRRRHREPSTGRGPRGRRTPRGRRCRSTRDPRPTCPCRRRADRRPRGGRRTLPNARSCVPADPGVGVGPDILEEDRLRAAVGKIGAHVLQRHHPGEPASLSLGTGLVRVREPADAAQPRTEGRVIDGDHRPEAARRGRNRGRACSVDSASTLAHDNVTMEFNALHRRISNPDLQKIAALTQRNVAIRSCSTQWRSGIPEADQHTEVTTGDPCLPSDAGGRNSAQRGRACTGVCAMVGALRGEGSNLQHPAPKADVLPIELPRTEAIAPQEVRHGAWSSPAVPGRGPAVASSPCASWWWTTTSPSADPSTGPSASRATRW